MAFEHNVLAHIQEKVTLLLVAELGGRRAVFPPAAGRP